jgi:hypothetical protein
MSLWVIAALVAALGVLIFVKVRNPPEPKGMQRKGSSSRTPGAGAGTAQAGPAPKKVKIPPEPVDKFRGAALFPQKGACEAIMKLRGKTFPEGRIPKIPVPGCDREKCDCQLHEIVGRRRGPRRVKQDRRGDVRFKEDRRKGKDRREGADTWTNSID